MRNLIWIVLSSISFLSNAQDSIVVKEFDCSSFIVKDGITFYDSIMDQKVNGTFRCKKFGKAGNYWTEYNYSNGIKSGKYKSTVIENTWSENPAGEFLNEENFIELLKSKCKALHVELNYQYLYKTIEVIAYNPETKVDQKIIDYLVLNVFQPLKEKYNCDQIVFVLNIHGSYEQQLNYDEFYGK